MIEGFTQAARDTMLTTLLPNATTFYIGLFVQAPTLPDGSDGVEASSGGYVRMPFHFSAPAYQTTEENAGQNDAAYVYSMADVVFPALTEALTIWAFGIWDAATDGNLLVMGGISDADLQPLVPADFQSGDQITFSTGEIFIALVNIVE